MYWPDTTIQSTPLRTVTPLPAILDRDEPSRAARRRRWLPWLEAFLVFGLFLVCAGWPVPEPNEPHYLGKAKHYWNTAWIEHDFFLDSADSHWAFYLLAG